MKDSIHIYFDCAVPVTTCNLRCHYCYITLKGQFKNKPGVMRYDPVHVAGCLTPERLGGICFFNMCGGGETLLHPSIVQYVKALLEMGHYVSIVTNGTLSAKFAELCNLPLQLRERIFIKFSYHFLELKRKNRLEVFFQNIRKVSDAGLSYTLELTPCDELLPHLDVLCGYALQHTGALPHVTVARDSRKADLPILTNMDRERYFEIWNNKFDSELFRYKMSIFGVKRKEFCYAGAWSYYLDLATGQNKMCHFGRQIQNIFTKPHAAITKLPCACHCAEPYCYNGHGWLAWGDIPALEAPSYAALRDRTTSNGEIWLKEPVKSFFSTKLHESNVAYTPLQQFFYNIRRRLFG